jgi:hypothetical protein
VPEDAARKKRIRAIAHAVGISYTAALRKLVERESREAPTLAAGEASARFGGPVGILAAPELPGPWLGHIFYGSSAPEEIRLVYGQRSKPTAFVLTHRSEPDGTVPGDPLVNALPNLLPGRGVEHARAALARVTAVQRQDAHTWLAGRRTPCQRIVLDSFQGLAVEHDGGVIVYCGPLTDPAQVRLDLDLA